LIKTDKRKGITMPASYNIGVRYETFVRGLVKSGRYASASEVVRDSLRLLEEREEQRQARIDALREDIRKGIESGPGVPAEQVFDRLERKYRNGGDE
jgi:antitoxin ParD1/3/4